MKQHPKLQLLALIIFTLLFTACADSGNNDDESANPVYWSRCESAAGITTAEIGTATITEANPSIYTLRWTVTGKFGNGMVNDSYAEYNPTTIEINGFNYEELTLSAWIMQYHSDGGTAAMHHTFYFTADTYIQFTISTSGYSHVFYVNGAKAADLTYKFENYTYQHITIAYSRTGCKVWQGETQILDYSGELPAATQCMVRFRSYHYGNNHMYAFLDNLKVWGRYIDDPEYRALEAAGTPGSETMLH